MSKLKHSVDLNLIFVLDALYRHQNVSKAALELRLTQSAISHALARLRKQYHDPLFVRTSKGIRPTEFAISIKADIEDLIYKAFEISNKLEQFNPAKAQGKIVISCTDFFEAVAGPKIYSKFQQNAPGVNLAFITASGAFPKDLLEEGQCDLAIGGYFGELPDGFYRQKLFTDSYAVCFRKGHLFQGKKVTEKMYFEAEHARMTLVGSFQDQLAKVVDGKKRSRNIKYASGNFSTLLLAAAKTDLLVTAPLGLLEVYKKHFDLQIEQCPIQVKPIEIEMSWHALTHQNPLRQWARKLIKDTCSQ